MDEVIDVETDRGEADIERALARELELLLVLDPRLQRIAGSAGPPPARRAPGGLPGLIATIVGQQVSRASAGAILSRFAALVPLGDAGAVASAGEAVFRQAGLSRGKQRTILGIAEAVLCGALDLGRIARLPPEDAVAELVRLNGIGPWTAQCFLLFSAGHADIFPAGDLALQVAAGHALGLGERSSEKALARTAAGWSPHRSVAARLFWAHYAAITRRDAAPVLAEPA